MKVDNHRGAQRNTEVLKLRERCVCGLVTPGERSRTRMAEKQCRPTACQHASAGWRSPSTAGKFDSHELNHSCRHPGNAGAFSIQVTIETGPPFSSNHTLYPSEFLRVPCGYSHTNTPQRLNPASRLACVESNFPDTRSTGRYSCGLRGPAAARDSSACGVAGICCRLRALNAPRVA